MFQVKTVKNIENDAGITEQYNLNLYNVSSPIPFSTPEIKRGSMYGW